MPDLTPGPGPDEAWDRLLHRLRQPATAQPPPFFYERVRARLVAHADKAAFRVPAWLRRPAYAAALALLVLAVSGDGAAASPGRKAATATARPVVP